MLKSETFHEYTFGDSYERFMSKHLQYYGFYSGKNRLILQELEGYEKTHGYTLSDDSHSDTQDEQRVTKNSDESRIPKTTQLVYNIFDDGRMIPKLKDPHVLHHDFVINLKQMPRWPIEMQVLPGRVTHIKTMPSQKELLYEQNGSEWKPQPKGEDSGDLVYEYNAFTGPFFIKSKFAQSMDSANNLKSASVSIGSDSDETLSFESRFESGNLEKVYKTGPLEYELHLRTDLYTSKHTQWYYFKIMNTRANKCYRFTIVNLYKADSLYNDGLKPLFYSDKDAQQSNKGWRRWGSNIVYYRNNRRYSTNKGDRSFYSLTWTSYFPHDKDSVYFSHCYPYTYSDLMQYIDNIKQDHSKALFCHIKLLTYSLADNLAILLTITNPSTDSVLEKKKKVIVITARVHPGETNASWMMEGILDYLLDDNPDSMLLRDLYIFKVVPMLNPDGVIVGNYRCSLSGRDLNRNYKSQLKSSYPIIASVRALIDRILKEREISFYCDLHGHSRKHNIFIYGCNDHVDENELLLERAFPVLLNRSVPDKFDDRSCKFKMQKSKAGTSRIVFRNLGITHSYTIEASFCGSTLKPANQHNASSHFHFNVDDLKSIGHGFCHSLLEFCDPDQKQIRTIVAAIKDELKNKIVSKLEYRGLNIDFDKASLVDLTQLELSDDDSSDGDDGSDSSDSNGLPAHYEYMDKQIRNNKKTNSKPKTKETKDTIQRKELEVLKTCMNFSKVSPNQTNPSNQNAKINNQPTKFSFTNSKNEVKNKDFKEKNGFLKKMQTMEATKKESPTDPGKRTIQELETPKIHLRYSGKSQYQSEPLTELCPFHEAEVLKEKETSFHQNSFVSPWKPSGNIPDSFYVHKPFKLKNPRRLTSGFLSKKIQELRFSPGSESEYPIKSVGMFSQKPLNPIKRMQPISLVKRQQHQTTLINQRKYVDKLFSDPSIDA